MTDHSQIWLAAWCRSCEASGNDRLWCEDNVFDPCDCGALPVRYVLASDAEAQVAALEKALHEARLHSQDNERAVLERAIARMGWPEIKAFRDQLALGQDIYEDAGGFIMRAIGCLFGLPAPDLIVTHQDAALAMAATALAKKET